ncbi:MAG TPA: nitroreductase family deazaflavin-dependent oxidoreductase [Acidimicrobiia bacterium]|nr:nitroreductase family deazaflavin-dependent oxidoreductase [Acidimicrobiia bacterium]
MTNVLLEEIESKATDAHERNRDLSLKYIASDGADVEHSMADAIILLYATGRTSGAVRRVPLVSFPDGDDLLVIASKGGAPDHPEWYRNLADDPKVWVRRKERIYEARATVLDGEERRSRWEPIIERHPVFGEYQEKAGRILPLVRLTEV